MIPRPVALERDPLIARSELVIKAHDVEAKDEGRFWIVHATLTIFVPFVFFTVMLGSMWEYFHGETLKLVFIFGFLVLASTLFFFTAKNKKAYLVRLCVLCLVGTLVATCVGFYIYYKYMVFWHAYGELRSYTNVAASQDSAQFADAGMLLFTSDTQVDTTRAVGYKDAESGSTLCVAPVVDGSMTQTDEISFWAVGTNCCEPRGHFACDGATNGEARSALLYLDADMLVSEGMQPVLEALRGTSRPAAYASAILLDQAAFATVPAKELRFLRWTSDPMALREVYRAEGLTALVYAIIIYAGLNLVFAYLAHKGIRRLNKSIRFVPIGSAYKQGTVGV